VQAPLARLAVRVGGAGRRVGGRAGQQGHGRQDDSKRRGALIETMEMGAHVDAKRYLQTVGADVASDFAKNRTILSFEQYLNLFLQEPRRQCRNAAQYLKDVIDHYGMEQVPHPSGAGKIRRFKIFDLMENDRDGRVAGQEEVQNAIYRLVGNFVRAGRINKLIFLHGPNGSAKSSIVDSLKRGMEHYSRLPQGALYKINWVFPTEKLVKGSIGFGEKGGQAVPGGQGGELASYAHLDIENIEVRLQCEMRDHPLFVIPREERKKLIDQALKDRKDEPGFRDYILPDHILEGELCHKCRRIFTALMAVSHGDYLKVLRHLQVERFYISRRYQTGTMTVEPQMSVDAAYHQVTADRSIVNMPAALQNVVLYEPHGALVNANRGLIEYADLLKRPLEAFKYLLGFSETAEVPLEHMILQLDELLIASSNEKHLAAFKELPDFASFKGRIELVRVPYLRRYLVEKEIYDAQITSVTVGKHVAPHATEVAAMWAVLTRLKKPIPDRYPQEVKEVVDGLTPGEKMHLYEEGHAPDRLGLAQAKELKKQREAVYVESDSYPNYEGRSGASAREIKTALFNAAQNPSYRCLNALAVLEELEALCKDKSVYEFLQQEVVDGYHDHEEFVKVVEAEYLDRVDAEVRDSMGLISEGQYRELFEKYVQHVSHYVRGEKMRNRITGEMERPDEGRMAEMEGIVMPKGEDAADFRRGLISTIGAHRLDNPDGVEMDYARIFPDLFRRLRDHFFEERKRVLRKNKENILKYLSDDRAQLSSREQQQVESTLKEMGAKYGYCEACAKDAILFLMRKRYAV
jgi:predicted Ser/Thr protein kinase